MPADNTVHCQSLLKTLSMSRISIAFAVILVTRSSLQQKVCDGPDGTLKTDLKYQVVFCIVDAAPKVMGGE